MWAQKFPAGHAFKLLPGEAAAGRVRVVWVRGEPAKLRERQKSGGALRPR